MLQNLLEISNDVAKDERRSLAINPELLRDKLERKPFDPRWFSGKELELLEETKVPIKTLKLYYFQYDNYLDLIGSDEPDSEVQSEDRHKTNLACLPNIQAQARQPALNVS